MKQNNLAKIISFALLFSASGIMISQAGSNYYDMSTLINTGTDDSRGNY